MEYPHRYGHEKINPYQRRQDVFKGSDMYPSIPGYCACRCGEKLTGRRTRWSSDKCRSKAYLEYCIIKGDSQVIRGRLFARDNGICKRCNMQLNFYDKWDADHRIPVYVGGGGITLAGYDILCIPCHKVKTKEDREKYKDLIKTFSLD